MTDGATWLGDKLRTERMNSVKEKISEPQDSMKDLN